MARNIVKRHTRIRKKIAGTAERPRLSVYRSQKSLYVQIIDDEKSVTLLGMSDKSLKKTAKDKAAKVTKKESAFKLGKTFGKIAIEAKITTVVFDRGGNKYHGRIAEFARGAREAGLIF